MGRAPCCAKVGLHRGPWSAQEDALLTQYIKAHGEGQWRALPKEAGILRCGKSCRLRWMNYLRPNIKRGNITPEEDDVIMRLHSLLGNKWSLIAARLPGRTDNEIKNYWNTHLSRKIKTQGDNQMTQKKQIENKRNKKAEKRNRQPKNNTKTNENITHYKVYHPKPIRAKPILLQRNDNSSDSNLASASGYSSQENATLASILIYGDHSYNAFSSSEFECQSNVSSTDESLEKLYEEYLQLVNADDDDDQIQFDGGIL